MRFFYLDRVFSSEYKFMVNGVCKKFLTIITSGWFWGHVDFPLIRLLLKYNNSKLCS